MQARHGLRIRGLVLAVLAGSFLAEPSWAFDPMIDGKPMNWTDFEASPLYSDSGAKKAELQALRDYHDKKYDTDLNAVADLAVAWINGPGSKVTKPAIVLDIDETSLSNFAEMSLDDFEFSPTGACPLTSDKSGLAPVPRDFKYSPDKKAVPCGAIAWDQSEMAEPIAATVRIFNAAKAHGVAVFFVTGRQEFERPWTSANLLKKLKPGDRKGAFEGYDGLFLRPNGNINPATGKPDLDAVTHQPDSSAAGYKRTARWAIQNMGFHVILSVGDQLSDLSGGYADQTLLYPNPYYRLAQ